MTTEKKRQQLETKMHKTKKINLQDLVDYTHLCIKGWNNINEEED